MSLPDQPPHSRVMDLRSPELRLSGLDKASPTIRRRHFFELHDQPWWPVPMREFMTNLLIIAWTFPWLCIKRNGRNIVPSFSKLTETVIERFLNELEHLGQPVSQISDLCSGSGGPWNSLRPMVEKYGINVILSDLYPPPFHPYTWHVPDRNASPNRSVSSTSTPSQIMYYSHAVDATNLPETLHGLRSLCCSFHHFRPDFASSILQDCIDKQLPVVVVETSVRSIMQICGTIIFMPLMALATPLAYPRATPWYLWVLTYLFPLTSFCACFDGVASCSRAYHPDEMLAVASMCRGANTYRWEAGVESFYGLFSLVYMTGRPIVSDDSSQT